MHDQLTPLDRDKGQRPLTPRRMLTHSSVSTSGLAGDFVLCTTSLRRWTAQGPAALDPEKNARAFFRLDLGSGGGFRTLCDQRFAAGPRQGPTALDPEKNARAFFRLDLGSGYFSRIFRIVLLVESPGTKRIK